MNYKTKIAFLAGVFSVLSGSDALSTQLCGPVYTERATFKGEVVYPERFKVPEEKRQWNIPYPEYTPPYYVDNHVKANIYHAEANAKGWAESENFTKNFPVEVFNNKATSNNPSGQSRIISAIKDKFSSVKNKMTKIIFKPEEQELVKTICTSICTSHQREWDNKINPPQEGKYFCSCILKSKFDSHLGSNNIQKNDKNLPLNPCGRTGIAGRGLLGKWGPNHAADPVITRYDPATGDLEVLLIKRDGGEWAIPGGMVDATDPNISAAAARELEEETGSKVSMGDAKEIYRGIVRDPRNTDNSWMETVVLHKHLSNELSLMAAQNLQAHDAQEIKKIRWTKWNDPRMSQLYASHTDFINKALSSMTKKIEPFAK